MTFARRSKLPEREPMKRIDGPTDSGTSLNPAPDTVGLTPIADEIRDTDFIAQYGESLVQTLDLDTWDRGENLANTFERLDREVAEALQQSDAIRKQGREIVSPQSLNRPNAPQQSGIIRVTTAQLKSTQVNILVNAA